MAITGIFHSTSRHLVESIVTIMILLAAFMATANDLHAQRRVPRRAERPDLWVMIDDSSYICRITHSGDTTPADWFCASYFFRMISDSANKADCVITGFKQNGRRIPLLDWKNDRIVNTAAGAAAHSSRTVDFDVAPGDTISFYRDVSWRSPDTVTQAGNVNARDTLACRVDLVPVDDANGTLLLDSIDVIFCGKDCTPIARGTRPAVALAREVVPSAFGHRRCFLRVRLDAHGDNEFDFSRTEMITVALWLRLSRGESNGQ